MPRWSSQRAIDERHLAAAGLPRALDLATTLTHKKAKKIRTEIAAGVVADKGSPRFGKRREPKKEVAATRTNLAELLPQQLPLLRLSSMSAGAVPAYSVARARLL